MTGVDQGLGDGVSRRRRLLPGQPRDCVGSERRERTPLHPPARTDHAAQRARHEEPLGDLVRAGVDRYFHAGRLRSMSSHRHHFSLLFQSSRKS